VSMSQKKTERTTAPFDLFVFAAMTAAMAAAAVVTAGVAFTVVVIVVAAPHIGVVRKIAGQEIRNCQIRVTGNAAIQDNAGFCQRHLCTAADTATDQHIYI